MLRIGIICPSEIALRRFMPALSKSLDLKYAGVAVAAKDEWYGPAAAEVDDAVFAVVRGGELAKAQKFQEQYGGRIFSGYAEMLSSGEIDAVYLPLPPGLHYRWAKAALQNGLHVFVEKPSTTSLENTRELTELAAERGLALHENYMFIYHSQLDCVARAIENGAVGEVRLYRIDFGFPERASNDFRYNKKLGGGALLDCGGYTLKYADRLLGGKARIVCAGSQYGGKYDVDIFGTATLCGETGQIVQVAFGMDNDYRCNIDVWGSKGTLKSGRILTAPEGFAPSYDICRNGEIEHVEMPADDTFLKSINRFLACVRHEDVRRENYREIVRQAALVDDFAKLAGNPAKVTHCGTARDSNGSQGCGQNEID